VDELVAAQVQAVDLQRSEHPFEIVLACNQPGAKARADLEDLARAAGSPRVRVVPAADRRGAAHARNVGVAHAQGDLLAFCDADDRVHDRWLDPLLRGLDEFDAVGGRLHDVRDDRHVHIRPPATPDGLPTFLGIPYIVTASMAVRRAAFETVGGFDEDLVRCEDIALSWSLLASGCRLGFVADSNADYTHRTGLRQLLWQHYLYGRGMSQVLLRYGKPNGRQWEPQSGMALLRPNAQPGGARTFAGTLRRCAIAAGRVVGIVEQRLSRRSRTP